MQLQSVTLPEQIHPVPPARVPAARRAVPVADQGWRLLCGSAWAFLALGLVDLGLVWYPLRVGNPEWEFGTVSAAVDGLPVPTLGLVLLLAASAAQGRLLTRRITAGLALLACVAIVGSLALYATTIPLALQSTTDPAVRLGLERSVGRTTAQGAIYGMLYLWLGVWGMRRPKTAG